MWVGQSSLIILFQAVIHQVAHFLQLYALKSFKSSGLDKKEYESTNIQYFLKLLRSHFIGENDSSDGTLDCEGAHEKSLRPKTLSHLHQTFSFPPGTGKSSEGPRRSWSTGKDNVICPWFQTRLTMLRKWSQEALIQLNSLFVFLFFSLHLAV